jgi:hypothetical protein
MSSKKYLTPNGAFTIAEFLRPTPYKWTFKRAAVCASILYAFTHFADPLGNTARYREQYNKENAHFNYGVMAVNVANVQKKRQQNF